MFADFDARIFNLADSEIFARIGGAGAPAVLLHGFPQTHHEWHRVAPILAQRFTTVVPDLRGYGRSRGPEPDARHDGYSKRSMARDIVAVMHALGFATFHVIGHDRGARVGYRLALDHPDKVRSLTVIDIVPTVEALERIDAAAALKLYHWFFLAQPHSVPEALIGSDPAGYLRRWIEAWVGPGNALDPLAVQEYCRAFENPSVVRAACEDYRAGIGVDAEHDRADRTAGRRISCPTLVLWGQYYYRGDKAADPLPIWQNWASNVRSVCMPTGHFPPEEEPAPCAAALSQFLDSASHGA